MTERTRAIAAVTFAIALPTLVTWIYFVALADQPARWQQTAYSLGKLVQFGFPVVWVVGILRRPWSRPAQVARGAWMGVAFGLLVGAAMLGLYHGWLATSGFFDAPAAAVRAKIAGMQLASAGKFALLGVGYSLGHSALEEYYWRWFVYGELRRLASFRTAALVSALGFTTHHVLVLATYFGWASPATWLFSAAITIGGWAWAWLYERSDSLVGPWLSHVLVDAAIFLIGYDLARSLFTP